MAAITAAVLTIMAAASAYQAVEANQSRQDAKGVANEQRDNANKAAAGAEAASTQANDLSTANAMRDAAKQRQQSIIGNSMGRGSTILTGGLGVGQPAAPGGGKQLLGQ